MDDHASSLAATATRSDAAATYRDRLAERRAVVEQRKRAEGVLAWLRLAIFAAGVLVAWFAFGPDLISWAWLFLPVAGFGALMLTHDQVIRARRRAERAADFYERGLARIEDRWAGQGNAGEPFADPGHPYTSDLDIFGSGSLFELICTARTVPGERTLARWLASPAPPDEVRERQQAIDELRPMLDLREQLALLGEDVGSGVDPDDLAAWATGRPLLRGSWQPWVAALLALGNVAGLLAWMASPTGALLFALLGGASLLFSLSLRARVHRVLHAVESRERGLELLALVLHRLEGERFRSPLLARLRARLDVEGQPPSRRIAGLARLVQIDESRHNVIFQPFAALMLLGTQLAFAMERWRRRSGSDVTRWLDALGSLEALSSLAGYAFEHPDDPFAEVVDEGPRLDGAQLGHPLLPEPVCVRNDVRLGDDARMLLVSGSNMSGKSTLLRTVGVNTVLALAGAPVRATSLTLSPLAVGAAMRVQDSLQAGLSHFYAEIKRLRALVDLGRDGPPLLFLLDEILHGTNSHDRRLGAEALLRGLVGDGAIGLVTTHDLALAEIVDRLGSPAANVHFEDQLEGEKIVFDFKLRPGVVQKGNALALMRAIGLNV
jgi:hypothetical protein